MVALRKIVIEIAPDKRVELSLDEAKELHTILAELFGPKQQVIINNHHPAVAPVIWPQPWPHVHWTVTHTSSILNEDHNSMTITHRSLHG